MIATLKNHTFTAQIDSLGAQLISLSDIASQKEYVWQRDAAYWPNASPLLFPVVGACRNDKTNIDGTWYEIPKHGFCKMSDFTVSQTSDTSVVFTLCDNAFTHTMYPYAFRLTLTYTLQEDGLHMDYEVTNTDSKPIHYLIGAHPGFNCPLEKGEHFEDYVLEFEQEETASAMKYDLTAGQFAADNRVSLLEHSRVLPLRYDLFTEDAIFFDSLKSKKVALKHPVTGKGLEMSFPDFETIAFWTPMTSKAPFLCIEPWNGSAIRSDEDDDFLNRHYLQTLEVGEQKQYHIGIRIL